jgi:pimeloyl-ACP methyl ester carboxylesterase
VLEIPQSRLRACAVVAAPRFVTNVGRVGHGSLRSCNLVTELLARQIVIRILEQVMADEGRIELYIESQGEGPKLVFLHGFGGSARNFRPQLRALSSAYRVIAFDARGHARSPAPEQASAYDPDCFVLDVAHIVRDAGDHTTHKRAPAGLTAPAGQVALAGLSMGAGIALRYAIGHSEDLYALVLASFPRAESDPSHREWAMGFADAIEQFGLDAAGERFVWGEHSRFDPRGAALIRQGFLEHRPHALVHTLRRVLAEQPAPSAMRDQLERMQVPTLLVAGENDPTALRMSEELARYLPNAEIARIAGAGHVVNLEAPQEFNAVLRRFLDAQPPKESVRPDAGGASAPTFSTPSTDDAERESTGDAREN